MKKLGLTFLVLAFCFVVRAQNKQPVAVKASVGDITDNRTTSSFNSECKVELKFTGDLAADAASVRTIRVKTAVDELGRDLTLKEENDSFGSSDFGRKSQVLKADLKLRNPSRHATTIKLIEGEVELFNPTQANGGILKVKDILKHPAEPVKDPVLDKHKVQLMYLTKESYEAKKKELEEQQKKEAGKLGEAFADLFKGMFGGMMSAESKYNVTLFVKDPEKRVVDVELQDAAGKALKTRGRWSSNEMRQINLAEAPPADAQLMIYLATPEAVQAMPFRVENIPLP